MAEQTTDPSSTQPPAPSGVFAQIAKRHEEIRADKSLELWIPGYEGMIKVRYRLLHDQEMDDLAQRANKVKPSEGIAGDRKASANALVRMCDQIIYREDESDQVLKDDKGPVRFDRRFAQMMEQKAGMQLSGETATEILIDFFSPLSDPENPSSQRTFPNAVGK
ncbi:MAG TPA: hypothetical protein VMS11_04665, partial [Solirubrobacterales bacterium]|nr:hypothetical protein [Solirubrobacterales bacterium]